MISFPQAACTNSLVKSRSWAILSLASILPHIQMLALRANAPNDVLAIGTSLLHSSGSNNRPVLTSAPPEHELPPGSPASAAFPFSAALYISVNTCHIRVDARDPPLISAQHGAR